MSDQRRIGNARVAWARSTRRRKRPIPQETQTVLDRIMLRAQRKHRQKAVDRGGYD